ncbi:MAG: cytochrome P450 [Blastochloris sp.]|nr:cytochrome P450 [Blastochloris sp.]
MTVFAFSPEANYQLLTDTDTFHPSAVNGPDTPAFRVLTGGFFTIGGDQYRPIRRLLLPAFHKQRVESYLSTMVAYTNLMLERWNPGETRDMCKEMQLLTLYIANKALFGLNASDETDNLGLLLQRWLNLAVSPATLVRWNQPFTPYGQLIRHADRVVTTIRALIARQRAAGARGDDMLSMLIQTVDEGGQQLTDDELVSNAGGLFIAGHETSSHALSWTLLLLALHPHILADLVDELSAVLGGGAPTIAHLDRLPLLDCVIKESMRLLPPASMLGRIAMQETELEGFAIPEGTEIIYSPYITHRIPSIFERPLAFNPERWQTIKPSPYAYLPFSAGPRMCLGAAFATLELKVILALLLQRYRVELPDGAVINRRLVMMLSPTPELPMRIHPQDRQFARRQPAVRGKIRTMVQLAT